MSDFAAYAQTFGIGLLVARVIVGLVMAAHGTQKLFGWFGGYGLNATGEFMVQLGFNQGRAFAALASLIEIASGLLVALGFLGPVGPALMISVMIVASITVHWKNGLFASKNGIEIPLLYMAAALTFAMVGYGPYSLDSLFGIKDPWVPSFTWIILAAGALGGLANVALSKAMKKTAKA
jgi:Predicted membrane protein